MQPHKLRWTLARSADAQKLVVDATIANTSRAPIWVAEQLVVGAPGGKFTRSDRITVKNSEDPEVAWIVLGAVSSDRPSRRLYQPTFERVAPGASVKRHFELPLPLATWHPLGGTNPLSPRTRRARLSVFALAGEPRWDILPSDDAEPLKVPRMDRAPLVFEGEALPLPD